MSGTLDPATQELSPDGAYVFMSEEVTCAHGATARHITSGGGGWGRAFDREPIRVLRDVRDGYVSLAGARRDYGVVVCGDPDRDPEGLTINEAATSVLRAGKA